MKLAQCVFCVRTTGIRFAVLAVLCIWQFSPSSVSAMEPISLADVIERMKPVVVIFQLQPGVTRQSWPLRNVFSTAISHLRIFSGSFSVSSRSFRLKMEDRARGQWVQVLLLIQQDWS